ncbi:MAG TPA: S8 family serine peptidase, partial [Roseiflexaceae bacterium]|nr:S8 family serine peptidase [Roseiflexaceae bacterium]
LDPWGGAPAPVDHGGHGTYTLGSALGRDGIGVAPGAEWVGCVVLERNLGSPPRYLDCLQFMLAPFPRGGDPFRDGDPARAPHVLNNSWGCPPAEGCDAQALRPAVEALRAAGIFVVAAVGNDGPACGSAAAPIGIYDAVFAVGAVDASGEVAPFSSRGPVTVDGSGRPKPDITAPGVAVVSSWPGGGYYKSDGTSAAAPHVAGTVALMWSANPALIGDLARTERMLAETARPPGASSPSCGGPGNTYGAGIVDAYAATRAAMGVGETRAAMGVVRALPAAGGAEAAGPPRTPPHPPVGAVNVLRFASRPAADEGLSTHRVGGARPRPAGRHGHPAAGET